MKTISSYVEGLTGAGPIIQTGILWASTIFISIYLVSKMVKVVKIYLTESYIKTVKDERRNNRINEEWTKISSYSKSS